MLLLGSIHNYSDKSLIHFAKSTTFSEPDDGPSSLDIFQ